jgi:hypothetical protein
LFQVHLPVFGMDIALLHRPEPDYLQAVHLAEVDLLEVRLGDQQLVHPVRQVPQHLAAEDLVDHAFQELLHR